MGRILGSLTKDRRAEVLQGLDDSADIDRDYILLVVVTCVIATFGLILDSGPIIIGAMLMSPLMPAVLAFALALIQGDLRRLWQSLRTLAVGILLAVALSALLGLLVSTDQFDFLAQLPGEILGFTRPTLFDLAVALAGGAAAAYALAQPHMSATLPGVAVATALMPPVCVIGIGLSQGEWGISGGALLLFLSNFAAIMFAGAVVFAGLGFGPVAFSQRRVVLSRSLLFSGALVLAVMIPLAWFMVGIIGDVRENGTIREVLEEQLALVSDNASLVGLEKQWQGDHLEIAATIYSPRNLYHHELTQMQDLVALRLQKPVALELFVIPVTRLDPAIPPTFTPTPWFALRPTAMPTAIPAPTDTPTARPTFTPTTPPTNTPSPLPTATPTPPPTNTPPLTPTLAPLSYAVVEGTAGCGAKACRGAGLDAPVITAVPEATVAQGAEGHEEVDNLAGTVVV